MTATKRRPRRSRPAHTASAAAPAAFQAPEVIYKGRPMPEWKWRTFPVYFAFAFGGFLGMYAGFAAGALESELFTLGVFVTFALLLGLGLSRLSSRWMLSKNFIKPRPQRKKR